MATEVRVCQHCGDLFTKIITNDQPGTFCNPRCGWRARRKPPLPPTPKATYLAEETRWLQSFRTHPEDIAKALGLKLGSLRKQLSQYGFYEEAERLVVDHAYDPGVAA